MSERKNATKKLTRLAGCLGAEIHGINLGRACQSTIDDIKALLLEHQVLFFPDQNLGIEQHVALGRNFGDLESHPHLNNPFTCHPEVFELAASHGGVADEWHSDISFQSSPSVMSILNMVKCPVVGGDTLWASCYAGYDNLSDPLKDMLEGLTALHDASPHGNPDICAIHPVVRIHPQTGRKSLFVNEHFTRRIVELSHPESRWLLDYLFNWIPSPRFTVRYRWQQGTIAMWDNRCTQHFVLNDFDEQRIIQRVTVTGDNPKAVKPFPWRPYTRAENAGASSRFDEQLNAVLGQDAILLSSNRKFEP
jgi:taurine dioxygenase